MKEFSGGRTIVIMAGGTGGHVFPALATALKLREQGHRVLWLGTRRGIEARVVPQQNFEIHFISMAGVRGKGWLRLLVAPWQLLLASWQALTVLRRAQPDTVLGMGGFVSGPGGLAAWLMNIPLVIHEQNAIAGTANKLLKRLATRVLQAFPDTFEEDGKLLTTGNPVRQEISELYRMRKTQVKPLTNNGALKLLVLGGSLGAQAINQLVPQALALLSSDLRPEVWHQCGKNKLAEAQQLYQQHEVSAKLCEFIDDMGDAYGWADLVICRAGALTVSELSNVGLPALLIPLPWAIDDHQTANANYLVRAKAGILLPQKALTAQALAEQVQQLLRRPDELLRMAQVALSLAQPEAADQVSHICLEVAHARAA